MNESSQKTCFAPAGRASDQTLRIEKSLVTNNSLVTAFLNAVPDFLMLLNEHRQIVAVNQQLLTTFNVENSDELLGLRPGEAVNCIHFKDGSDGCGTAQNCAVCGAVIAILASQKSRTPQKQECHLTIGDKQNYTALDLDVLATPISVEGEFFTVLSLRDISSEKRRNVMEKVFFHDVLNSAGGIRGLASLLAEGARTPEEEQEYKEWMVTLSDSLIEEINHQRKLLQAEKGEYIPDLEPVDLSVLLRSIYHLYGNYDHAPGRTLELDDSSSCVLVTDQLLLRRIVGNMVINALEASKTGDTVSLWSHCQSDRVRISVTNPGEIPLDVQLQLFKRSFSTKGKIGRGLGTYSMKLFGERYLGGVVDFHSNNGLTTFFIELPLNASDSAGW